MSLNIYKALDKDQQNKTLHELLDAPVAAFSGISETGGELLAKLGLKTIGDLATWKFAIWARAISDLARAEQEEKAAAAAAAAAPAEAPKAETK